MRRAETLDRHPDLFGSGGVVLDVRDVAIGKARAAIVPGGSVGALQERPRVEVGDVEGAVDSGARTGNGDLRYVGASRHRREVVGLLVPDGARRGEITVPETLRAVPYPGVAGS